MTAAADQYRARYGIDPGDAAGLVQVRLARQTGGLVGVYDAAAAGMEGSGWASVCEVHGVLVVHDTRALAIAHAADPCGWCERCRGAEAPPAVASEPV